VTRLAIAIALSFVVSGIAFGQADETNRARNKPVPPFRIVGNLYYVGAAEVTSFLITTPKGDFLLDGGFAETAPQIEHNISQLGFDLRDVKFLLNSHAHFDHAGGLAELKKLSGAKFVASDPDAPLLKNGGRGDFRFGDTLPFPPVEPDQIIHDGPSHTGSY
jgi:metallo-beta-lactamase class B